MKQQDFAKSILSKTPLERSTRRSCGHSNQLRPRTHLGASQSCPVTSSTNTRFKPIRPEHSSDGPILARSCPKHQFGTEETDENHGPCFAALAANLGSYQFQNNNIICIQSNTFPETHSNKHALKECGCHEEPEYQITHDPELVSIMNRKENNLMNCQVFVFLSFSPVHGTKCTTRTERIVA